MSCVIAIPTRVNLWNHVQSCKTLDLTSYDMTTSKEQKRVVLVGSSRAQLQAYGLMITVAF